MESGPQSLLSTYRLHVKLLTACRLADEVAQGNAQFLLWLTEQLATDHTAADVAPLRIPDLRSYLSNDLRKVPHDLKSAHTQHPAGH